ncbi:MAG: hypothetical protein ISQ07_10945 [Pirellulales bacterium]|nr:hypothetical protein [Pirellulales bacterium]
MTTPPVFKPFIWGKHSRAATVMALGGYHVASHQWVMFTTQQPTTPPFLTPPPDVRPAAQSCPTLF